MRVLFTSLIVVITLGLLTACGTPGAPQPPSLQLARPVQDLTAVRKGDVVTLTWTAPGQTTDGQNIRARYAGPTYICRMINARPMLTCQYSVGSVEPVIPAALARGEKKPAALLKTTYADKLPLSLQQLNPTGFAEYTVNVTNHLGRSAGLSNPVWVPLAPTSAPPARLSARVTAEAIEIGFACPATNQVHGLAYAAHLYRRDSAGNVADVGSQPLPATLCAISDTNFEWEKNYAYWVTEITAVSRHGKTVATVSGDDSPIATVFTHDVFPPAVPEGLEAVASGAGQKPFVDLTWTPDTDPDLEGYNVYRRQGTGDWEKLNSRPVKTPSYRDEHIQSGRTYSYAVSAIDARGNQSQRSAPASEAVP